MVNDMIVDETLLQHLRFTCKAAVGYEKSLAAYAYNTSTNIDESKNHCNFPSSINRVFNNTRSSYFALASEQKKQKQSGSNTENEVWRQLRAKNFEVLTENIK
uniref:Uncharacterized protein n=1 Tax=Glossina palpalis gambiensis TaxID=67801 RepID=A0A1B0AQ28_9MUSC